jgi:hypothetical protein
MILAVYGALWSSIVNDRDLLLSFLVAVHVQKFQQVFGRKK